MTFSIGQIFEGTYPPEAAVWCNDNDAHIAMRDEGGFIIVENPPPPEVEEMIDEQTES